MQVTQKGQQPDWHLFCICPNPWCFSQLRGSEQHVKYGQYPESTGYDDVGFWIACPNCRQVMVIHESMLFVPMAQRLKAKAR